MRRRDLFLVLKSIVELRVEEELFGRKTCRGGLRFICKLCGRRFNTERSVRRHIRKKHGEEVKRMVLKRMRDRRWKARESLLENMDMKRLMDLDVDITTAEGLAKMVNEVLFHGDWERYIRWVERYGSEQQKREDIPLLRKLMKEEERKKR